MAIKRTAKRYASIERKLCVACGACGKVCPKGAVAVFHGCYAEASPDTCVGCGLCARICPANAITIADREVC